MVVVSAEHRQIERIDQQLLDLLEERALLYAELSSPLDEQQCTETWVEWGGEHGLDEVALERVCRAVITLSRKAREE